MNKRWIIPKKNVAAPVNDNTILDTDVNMEANSNVRTPSQRAVNARLNGLKSYVDSVIPKFKVVACTRAMDAATGDVSYTGAGFKPSAVLAYGAGNTGMGISGGMADSETSEQCIYHFFNAVGASSANLIFAFEDATPKNQTGNLKSFDADGCTIAWTRNGATAAGTFSFILIFIR